MWELDCKESWAPKNRRFWPVVLEMTLESPLDCKEIQPVYSKGDQPWDLFGRNDAKAETPVLWPPHAKSWLIGKDPDAGRYWEQKEKGTTEDEMAGWHHWLDGRESEWTLGVGDGQGGLVCCDSWVRKESDMTMWLSWTELNWALLKRNNEKRLHCKCSLSGLYLTRIFLVPIVMDWMFVLATNSYVEILTLRMMILGGRDLERWLGHEDGPLMNRISILTKEMPGSFLALSTMWGHNTTSCLQFGRESLPGPDHAGPWSQTSSFPVYGIL